MNSLEKHIIEVIAQFSEIDESLISLDSTFQDLSLTSLDAVTISYELEQEFGVQIPDDKVYTIKTVKELFEGIQTLLEVENIDG
ncbi:MAG: phosphopantetheine-binding protein [Gammaproteobacteria bacterium]|nr:phosphopantetheine-binding protein [Gammaproteobacteria bacterium]MDH5777419.1 phosphopantetheine-binding protein [Gammaproteobacteria bacterium]